MTPIHSHFEKILNNLMKMHDICDFLKWCNLIRDEVPMNVNKCQISWHFSWHFSAAMSTKVLNLNSNGTILPVQQSILLEKLTVFRENPQLLCEPEYRVRSQVPETSFCEFVQFVNGSPFKLTTENVNFHLALSEEFGFKTLFCECVTVTSNKIDNVVRLSVIEERLLLLERLFGASEKQVKTLSEENEVLSRRVLHLENICEEHERRFSEQIVRIENEELYRRGLEFLHGTNLPDDQRRGSISERLGFSLLRTSADRGHSDAQFQVGLCLNDGRGCVKDKEAAMPYFRQSADSGNPLSQALCGGSFLDGMGVPKDRTRGMEYLQRSADGGHSLGQVMLSISFLEGEEANPDLMMHYFGLAAAQGNPVAQFGLADILLDGELIAADPQRAVELLEKAARSGNDDAQFRYAGCLEKGIGCKRNLPKAFHYFELAILENVRGAEDGFKRCFKALR
jgi:TPR repeat protein